MARRSGPAFPSRQKRPSPSRTPEEREWRTQQRYLKVLREVKEECGDTALSSDEEGASSSSWELSVDLHHQLFGWSQWWPFCPSRAATPMVCLRWCCGTQSPWSSGPETLLFGGL